MCVVPVGTPPRRGGCAPKEEEGLMGVGVSGGVSLPLSFSGKERCTGQCMHVHMEGLWLEWSCCCCVPDIEGDDSLLDIFKSRPLLLGLSDVEITLVEEL